MPPVIEHMLKVRQNKPHKNHMPKQRIISCMIARLFRTGSALALLASIASGCSGTSSQPIVSQTPDKVVRTSDTQITEPYNPQSPAAHYLAARQALYINAIEDSAYFYMRTLEAEPTISNFCNAISYHNIILGISNAPPASDASWKA